MLALVLTLLIHPGHHYGWQQPHNPHRHVGPCQNLTAYQCALINPPPHIIVPQPPRLP